MKTVPFVIVGLLVMSTAACNRHSPNEKDDGRGRRAPSFGSQMQDEPEGNGFTRRESDEDRFADKNRSPFQKREKSYWELEDDKKRAAERKAARARGEKPVEEKKEEKKKELTPEEKLVLKLRGRMGNFGSCVPKADLVDLPETVMANASANISLTGVVTSASFYGGGLSDEATKCMEDRIIKMKFPRQENPMSISTMLTYKIPKVKTEVLRRTKRGTPGYGTTVSEEVVKTPSVQIR